MSLQHLRDRHENAISYINLREANPTIPALTLWRFVREGDGQSLAEYTCPGHEWAYTGSAYGGDDASFHGEGRCYCRNCGADGDA